MPLPLIMLIQAVPWEPARTKNAIENAQRLGAEIVWDETQSGWDTYLAVLKQAGDNPVVILEDDVVLSERFEEIVGGAIAARPDEVINFFSYRLVKGGRRPGYRYTANVCHYLPQGMSKQLLLFAPEWLKTKSYRLPDQDMLIRDFLIIMGQDYWLETPNPVDHLELESVSASYRKISRRSKTFVS
jgi:hypothetical protein